MKKNLLLLFFYIFFNNFLLYFSFAKLDEEEVKKKFQAYIKKHNKKFISQVKNEELKDVWKRSPPPIIGSFEINEGNKGQAVIKNMYNIYLKDPPIFKESSWSQKYHIRKGLQPLTFDYKKERKKIVFTGLSVGTFETHRSLEGYSDGCFYEFSAKLPLGTLPLKEKNKIKTFRDYLSEGFSPKTSQSFFFAFKS